MRVVVRTNLDLVGESWPCELPCLPNSGDYIQSTTKHDSGFQLKLKVMDTVWKFSAMRKWYPEIELGTMQTLTDFYEWYAPLVGRSVPSFI